MSDKIVMYDSDAAAHEESVTGWVDRQGRFWGNDERAARTSGATHKKCETCDNIVEIGRIRCDKCQHNRDVEKYESMEHKDWDGTTPLYSQEMDEYLFGLEEFMDDLEFKGIMDSDISTMRFVICEEQKFQLLDEDQWMEDLAEDMGLPGEVSEAIQIFNEVLKEANSSTWRAGNYRTTVKR